MSFYENIETEVYMKGNIKCAYWIALFICK